MKKIMIAALCLMITGMITSNAFALTWFWGDGAQVDVYKKAVPSLVDSNRVWVPFTIEASGEYLSGVASHPDPYFNGAPGSSEQRLRIDNNMNFWLGQSYSTDTVFERGFAVTSWNSYTLGLLDGVYTPGGDVVLTYYAPEDLDRTNLLRVASSNSFEVTVGEGSNAVPEPATMVLMGIGLGGMALRKRFM